MIYFLLKLKLKFLYYKLTTNQTYWWNFGELALYFFVIQIIIFAKLKKQIIEINKIINKY